MLKRCPNCGAARLESRTMTRKRHVAGHVFTADLPAGLCAKCGTSYFDDVVVGQLLRRRPEVTGPRGLEG